MKKLFFILVLLTAVFSGCKKDEPAPVVVTPPVVVLDRAKFLGHWTGTQTTNIKANGVMVENSTTATYEQFDIGLETNEVILNKGTDSEFKATVSGSKFDLIERSQFLHISDGTIAELFVSGDGSVSANGVLTMTYVMEGSHNGIDLVVIMTESLNKD